MFTRNLFLLAIFDREAVSIAVLPITARSCCAAIFVWLSKGSRNLDGELKLSSPVSIRKLVSFGTLFLLIEVAGAIGKRYLGHYGVIIVSLVGGLVSSASTTAAAAMLAAHGETAASTAGLATVITSIASGLSKLPVIYRVTRNAGMTWGLIDENGRHSVSRSDRVDRSVSPERIPQLGTRTVHHHLLASNFAGLRDW